jgi:hypothetical protein
VCGYSYAQHTTTGGCTFYARVCLCGHLESQHSASAVTMHGRLFEARGCERDCACEAFELYRPELGAEDPPLCPQCGGSHA